MKEEGVEPVFAAKKILHAGDAGILPENYSRRDAKDIGLGIPIDKAGSQLGSITFIQTPNTSRSYLFRY